MGKASSSKKVARAARAAGRPGASRSLVWPLTIGGVVALGVLLILLTISGPNKGSEPPTIQDHWHAAYGIFNCNSFIPEISDVVDDTSGIHSHAGQALIHIHPFSTKFTGSGANLGNWGKTVGLELHDDSIKTTGIDVENGDKCDGKPGKVRMKVWTNPDDATGHELTKDFAKFAPQNFNVITIAFLPADAEIPRPPDAAIAALQAPTDLSGAPPATDATVPGTVPVESSTTASTATSTP